MHLISFRYLTLSLICCMLQVRKAAQQGVCAILRGSDCMFGENALSHHPAAITTAKYCIKEMEQAGGRLRSLHAL